MSLTPSQLTALKSLVDGDPALAAFPNNSDGNYEIARLLNLEADPAWVIWRINVTRQEILQNGFDWTRLDNLSVGKARIWSDIFVDGYINPSKPNVRTGIEAVWVGTAADLAVRAAVFAHCKANASRVLKLFSTGTGSTNSPADLASNLDETFRVDPSDIETARNL